MKKEKIIKDTLRYWTSKKCPNCKNDILMPSDLWRHQEGLCMTNNSKTISEEQLTNPYNMREIKFRVWSISFVGNGKNGTRWECRCDCGNKKIVD